MNGRIRRLFSCVRTAVLAVFTFSVVPALPPLASENVSVTTPADEVDWLKERRFWSFRAPAAQPWPRVKNKRWPQQPLDYFVLARLEQKQLTPSVEATRDRKSVV